MVKKMVSDGVRKSIDQLSSEEVKELREFLMTGEGQELQEAIENVLEADKEVENGLSGSKKKLFRKIKEAAELDYEVEKDGFEA